MTIVSNASPIHYLLLLGRADVLPALYRHIVVPPAVMRELSQPDTPDAVRQVWLDVPPWLSVYPDPIPVPAGMASRLHAGEIAAIGLALHLKIGLVLLDDYNARREAENRGLAVAGTLRVLADAALAGLLSLPAEFARLQQTNFRASRALYDRLLDEVSGPLE